MLLRPCNRYLLVEPIEEESVEQTAILLPDDYKDQNPYGVAIIINRAKDCDVDAYEGDTVVFSTNMLETITLNGKDSFLLLENYVLGTIHEKN